MLSYQVCRDIEIEKTPEFITEFISNFKNWPDWSPWLIMERNCTLTYNGDLGNIQSGYEWSGNLVGAGSMVLTSKSDTQLEMSLTFLRPFKSTAIVKFKAQPTPLGTRVSWVMESRVPWFLFFLKHSVCAPIKYLSSLRLYHIGEPVAYGSLHLLVRMRSGDHDLTE